MAGPCLDGYVGNEGGSLNADTTTVHGFLLDCTPMMGQITPPVGINVFVIAGVAKALERTNYSLVNGSEGIIQW